MTPTGCLDFIDSPDRPRKPRKTGITVTSDRQFSMDEARAFVETAGDIVDHIKIPDHYGLLRRYSPEWVKKKTAYYKSVGIDSTPGGIVFEMAALQGKVPQFMKRIAELGFTGVEVSEDMLDVPLSPKDRKAAVRHGIENGLHVFTELGRKFSDKELEAEEAIEMANEDLESGAFMVVVEKADIAKIRKDGRDDLHRLMETVPRERLILEAGPGDWPGLARWLIQEFGPEVNIENVGPENVITLEAMRHGLTRAAEYRYFEQFSGVRPPPID